MSTDATTAVTKSDVVPKSRATPKQAAAAVAAAVTTTTATTTTPTQLPNNIKLLGGDLPQLLGSTFLPNDAVENGHSLRASARVIHKNRMDSLRQPSPPPTVPEKKETENRKTDHKNPRTPSQQKTSNRVVWSNAEKNMFFEALNEYGRDFEAIATYINNKQRRRNLTDILYKTKDQVRVLYYQFFQKASKYLRFSDEIKKNAQELYALINYGEMRKKCVFLSDKVFFKLHDLVYKGSITLRIKGKNVKIKTPSCRALRKLNQLEEWQEEIKLPPRIDVVLRPANVDSWGRVQAVAQNPRIKTQVPLQRRISSLLVHLQHRWRSQELRLQEKAMTLQHPVKNKNRPVSVIEKVKDTLICFAPLPDAPIHRPVIHLSEFLSSDSICLNAYEQRIGVKVRGATLTATVKRQRHDSEKVVKPEKSPDLKKLKLESDVKDDEIKVQELLMSPNSSSRDSLDALKDIRIIETIDFKEAEMLSDIDVDLTPVILSSDEALPSRVDELEPPITNCDNKKTYEVGKVVRKRPKKKEVKPTNFRPLISEHVLKEIREGWTVKNAADLTFGDLYVMFGAETKLYLEYSWVQPKEDVTEATAEPEVKKVRFENIKIASQESISDKLKQLLQIAQLSDKLKRKPTCSCGHICKKNPIDGVLSPVQNGGDLFKHPALHRRNLTYGPAEIMRSKLSKFGRPRTRPLFPTKQIIVQRFLPVQPGMNQTYGVLSSDGSLKKSPATQRRTTPDVQQPQPPQQQPQNLNPEGDVSQILTAKMKQITDEKVDGHTADSFGSFMDLSLPGYCNTPLMSPMGIIRESPVGESYNVEDVSLSSILGHLENACNSASEKSTEQLNLNQNMPVLNDDFSNFALID